MNLKTNLLKLREVDPSLIMKIGKELIGSGTFGVKVVVKEMKKMEWFLDKNQTVEIFYTFQVLWNISIPKDI